jgi:hypothetical protein
MPGAGVGWRTSNTSRKRFDLLGSIVWTQEDESATLDLTCTVNSLSALNREQGVHPQARRQQFCSLSARRTSPI